MLRLFHVRKVWVGGGFALSKEKHYAMQNKGQKMNCSEAFILCTSKVFFKFYSVTFIPNYLYCCRTGLGLYFSYPHHVKYDVSAVIHKNQKLNDFNINELKIIHRT